MNQRVLLMIGGGVLVLVLIGILISRGDDSSSPVARPTSTAADATPVTSETRPRGETPQSEVPPIDCNDVLTSDEIGAALGFGDNPDLGTGMSGLSQNETCTQTVSVDERYFVQVSPSGPSDFMADSELLGVSGTPVEGIGDAAVWFGGSQADGGGVSGVLAVREQTEHGRLFVRVFIGRPDVGEPTQRQIAVDLAALALPRFPGVVREPAPAPDPEPWTFAEAGDAAPDGADRSLAEHMLAGEARGEWDRGEGLVTALRLVAGELETVDVLDGVQLRDPSASLVIGLARDHLDDSPDPLVAGEIDRLLGLLIPDREEGPPAGRLGPVLGGPWSLLPAPQEEGEEDPNMVCEDPEVRCANPVAIEDRPGLPQGKYQLFADTAEGSGWTKEYVDAAASAVPETAVTFELLGEMPATSVVLQTVGEFLYVDSGRTDCVVHISHEVVGSLSAVKFQQLLAREMAFCLIGTELRDVVAADRAGSRWWTQGLAQYLSGVAFPEVNAEHENLPQQLAEEELSTTLADRTWTNWAFFEHLHLSQGADGNMALVGGFPVGGDHVAALAAVSNIRDLFHEFEQALTDSAVLDVGPGTIPYEADSWDLNIFVPVEAELSIPVFGVRRIHITVPDGTYACFETVERAEPQVSWRPGVPGEPGDWEAVPPVALEGESMLVLTATEAGAFFTLTVTEVSDDADCAEESPPPTTTLGDCGICGPSLYYYL